MNLQRREEIREMIAEIEASVLDGSATVRDLCTLDAMRELIAHIDTLEQTAAERVIADGSRGPTPDYTGEGSAWVPPVETQAESADVDLSEGAWISISKYKLCDHGHRRVLWISAEEAKMKMPGCVEAQTVAVPELTPEWCDEIWRNAPRNVLTWAVIEWICKQDRERFRAIPADRVPGEEMVALRRFAERCAQRDHQPDEHIGSAKCVACEAEDALRANQGGAAK